MLTRRQALALTAAGVLWPRGVRARPSAPNVLLITLDDCNADIASLLGPTVAPLTPSIDALARGGIRFRRAHANIAVCQPSRAVMMTGRYPMRNGAMGFEAIREEVPLLPRLLADSGYQTGILGKVGHLEPVEHFNWSEVVPRTELGFGRDPGAFAHHADRLMRRAMQDGRPFFLMVNTDDPHYPFANSPEEQTVLDEMKVRPVYPPPTRSLRREEVRVPGFLPASPALHDDITRYCESVSRADETVGAVLARLEALGLAQDTLVILLSDHGMPFPFAKTACYPRSTHIPWIMRWPARIEPGQVDDRHLLSTLDLMPTVLELVGLPPVQGLDGQSAAPLLSGRRQRGRKRVYTVFHKTLSGESFPTRALLGDRYAYIFNAWSDGETRFSNNMQQRTFFASLQAEAAHDPVLAERLDFFFYRTPEELYDLRTDFDARVNLASERRHRPALRQARRELLEWMLSRGDPLAVALQERISRPRS